MTSSLNILCFGDSLTEGYSKWGAKFTPYGRTLGGYLREQLEDVELSRNLKVRIEGVSGERVTDSMLRRMERLCRYFLYFWGFLFC